jgi:hypothetical protein
VVLAAGGAGLMLARAVCHERLIIEWTPGL